MLFVMILPILHMYKKTIMMRLLGVTATLLMTRRKTLTRKPTYHCLTNQCGNQHQEKTCGENSSGKKSCTFSSDPVTTSRQLKPALGITLEKTQTASKL